MPTWTPEPPQQPRAPEPERRSAPPQPHPSYPTEAPRPAYDSYEDFVERSNRAALNLGPQEPRPFESEASEPDLDPFAANELKRYLAGDAEEQDQPFAERSYEAAPAAYDEEEDTSFASEDHFEPEAQHEPQLFESQDYASEEDSATYDAEFSPYNDHEDAEDQAPSYGDAFGQDPQDFVRASEELDEAFGREAQDLDEGVDVGSRQVQPFEARYDQHPEIALGRYPQQQVDASFEQSFFADEQGDAELDVGEQAPVRKGRKRLAIAASLVGALAVGGGLAYLYKDEVVGVAGSSQPPLITADQRPVKTTPTDPGGKVFPHKNKLIYDRLQGEEPAAEQERLVPRQEDVATGSAPTAQPSGGAQQVAVATQTATDAETSNPASEPAASSRRVRTFVVLPDGSVVKPDDAAPQAAAAVAPAQPEAPEQPASIPGLTVTLPGSRPATNTTGAAPTAPSQGQAAPSQPAAQPERQQQLASVQSQPEPVAAPVRKPAAPAPQQAPVQQAAVQPTKPAPQAAAAEGSGSFVVQVAARKSQTDALAAFADLQQRYPQLLSGYRPIIERADLGNKGVWYRLRVGPMETKTVAANLCGKLQAAGMKECLIYPQ